MLVTVYDVDGSQIALDNSKLSSRYYVLGMLTNKNVAPHKNDDGTWSNVVAWGLKEFKPYELDHNKQIGNDPADFYEVTSTDLVEFNTYGDFVKYENDGEASDTVISYSSDYYDFTARVYRSLNWGELKTLADCVNPDKASDSILGYKFGKDDSHFTNWNNGDTDKIAITKFTSTYDIELEADGDISLTDDDNLFLRVEVNHGSNNSSYYVKKLTSEDFVNGNISIQTEDTSYWYDINGNIKSNERVTGDDHTAE